MADQSNKVRVMGKIFLYESGVIVGTSLAGYIGYAVLPMVDGFPLIYLWILFIMGATLYVDNEFYDMPYHVQDFIDAKARLFPIIIFSCIGIWVPDLVCEIKQVSKARFRRECPYGEQLFWFLVILLAISIFRLAVGLVILGYKFGVKGVSKVFGLKDQDE